MKTKQNDVALIVHGCDRYEFLYKGFTETFSKNWDYDVKCNYYFATEEKNVFIDNFKNIQSGKGEWTNRLATLLKNEIKEKYVLYMQEDMWINKKIDAKFLNQLFALAEENNWQQVKLHSSGEYKTIPTSTIIEGFMVATLDNEQSNYLMSHQITLWNKAFFLSQLQKKEHPWKHEHKATKRLRKSNATIFQIDYFAVNGDTKKNNLNNSTNAGSEYQTVSSNGMLNNFVEPFIDDFKNGNVEYQEYAKKLEHNYTNFLTHDGKPKPHKVEIIEVLKGKIWKLKNKLLHGFSNR